MVARLRSSRQGRGVKGLLRRSGVRRNDRDFDLRVRFPGDVGTKNLDSSVLS